MKQYLDLLDTILTEGEVQGSRAVLSDGSKPNTLSTFGLQAEYGLTGAFPIVTTKKIPFRQIVVELLWFLSGSSNVRRSRTRASTSGTSGLTRTASWGSATARRGGTSTSRAGANSTRSPTSSTTSARWWRTPRPRRPGD